MLGEAQQQSEHMVEQNEVTRLASAQAREIIASAEYDAKDMLRGADEYAIGVLGDLERSCKEILSTVERGRRKLDQRTQQPVEKRPTHANGAAEVAGSR
jgi:hypothetical protein